MKEAYSELTLSQLFGGTDYIVMCRKRNMMEIATPIITIFVPCQKTFSLEILPKNIPSRKSIHRIKPKEE